MFCKHCGNQVADGTKFCPNCGGNIGEASASAAQPQQNYTQPQQSYAQSMHYGAAFCCPNCGSENLTKSSDGMTEEWWCHNCGNKFTAPDQTRRTAKIMKIGVTVVSNVLTVIMAIFWLISYVNMKEASYYKLEKAETTLAIATVVAVIFVILDFISVIAMAVKYKKMLETADATESAMRRFTAQKRSGMN